MPDETPPVEPTEMTGRMPKNVVNHIHALLTNIQPSANWAPSTLRDHADAKELFGIFARMVGKQNKVPVEKEKDADTGAGPEDDKPLNKQD